MSFDVPGFLSDRSWPSRGPFIYTAERLLAVPLFFAHCMFTWTADKKADILIQYYGKHFM